MGVYNSRFVIEPNSEVAVSGFSHPSKPNWITAHAISTELSIAEVERLWLRFQQMGANKDGVLTQEVLTSQKLSTDVFTKNILKNFKSSDGNISFESFLRALKWCESQDPQVKVKAIFQMLNNGSPIPNDIFEKILRRLYPEGSDEEIKRITTIFFKTVDTSNKGVLDESSFVRAVLKLPQAKTQNILNFHILPEQMRQQVHSSLPEMFQKTLSHRRDFKFDSFGFSSQAGFYNTPTPYAAQIPSDVILKEIAEKIHRKDWDLVANRLGFFADDIERFRKNNPDNTYQQVLQMLMKWKTREGDNAKASTLEKILRNAGMIEASLLLAP